MISKLANNCTRVPFILSIKKKEEGRKAGRACTPPP